MTISITLLTAFVGLFVTIVGFIFYAKFYKGYDKFGDCMWFIVFGILITAGLTSISGIVNYEAGKSGERKIAIQNLPQEWKSIYDVTCNQGYDEDVRERLAIQLIERVSSSLTSVEFNALVAEICNYEGCKTRMMFVLTPFLKLKEEAK